MAPDIRADRWYNAREAGVFLEVTAETIKRHCRDRKISGKRRGPKKQWYVLGTEITRVRREWALD